MSCNSRAVLSKNRRSTEYHWYTQSCGSVGSHRTDPVTLTLKDSHTLWNVGLIDRCLKRVTEVVDGDRASVAEQQACTSVLQEPHAFVCVYAVFHLG